MSTSDISAGRMAPAQARSFGAQRARPIPRPQPFPAVAWQAARQSLRRSFAQLSELWQQGVHSLPRLPELTLQGAKSLASLPGLLLQGVHSLAATLKPSEAWSREAAIRALLHSNASATFVRLLAYVGALGVLALIAAHLIRTHPSLFEAESVAPTAEWVNVAKPFPAFSLPMSSLFMSELAESAYAMRRHAAGGRQDIMRWGALQNDAAPHFMVEIYRPAAELARFESATLEIAARLEGVDAALVKPAGEMETKFGPVSLVEFSLKSGRQCLGFAHAYDNPRLQILGWHCVSSSAPVERDLAACAIDRLALLAAGSEPKVRELFARAELKRNFCGQPSPLMAPTLRLGPSAQLPRGRVATH